eukprot:6618686-Alexandrium_andersonii.AAC.1
MALHKKAQRIALRTPTSSHPPPLPLACPAAEPEPGLVAWTSPPPSSILNAFLPKPKPRPLAWPRTRSPEDPPTPVPLKPRS